jgi:hypothetical protein
MTQRATAWLFGVDDRTMRTAAWKGAPRNPDGSYNARVLIAWRLERDAEGGETDPLLAGSNSPALERFRSARADREELELAVRREQLIDVDEFLGWWDEKIASPLRKGLDRLQKKHGSKAVKLVADGLRQSEEAVSSRFRQTDEK